MPVRRSMMASSCVPSCPRLFSVLPERFRQSCLLTRLRLADLVSRSAPLSLTILRTAAVCGSASTIPHISVSSKYLPASSCRHRLRSMPMWTLRLLPVPGVSLVSPDHVMLQVLSSPHPVLRLLSLRRPFVMSWPRCFVRRPRFSCPRNCRILQGSTASSSAK